MACCSASEGSRPRLQEETRQRPLTQTQPLRIERPCRGTQAAPGSLPIVRQSVLRPQPSPKRTREWMMRQHGAQRQLRFDASFACRNSTFRSPAGALANAGSHDAWVAESAIVSKMPVDRNRQLCGAAHRSSEARPPISHKFSESMLDQGCSLLQWSRQVARRAGRTKAGARDRAPATLRSRA